MSHQNTTYILHLRCRPKPEDPQGTLRLRRLLRYCQRVLEFRLLKVEQDPSSTE